MGLLETVSEAVKQAMKAQDKDRLAVLRMLLAELKYAKTALTTDQPLSEESALKSIASYYKKIEKSIADFPTEEAKNKIRAELKVVEEFLPKKMSIDEIKRIVDEAIAKGGQIQFGTLMKDMMQKIGAAADGKVLSQIIKEKLEKK